jgi:hypothetical protein
MKRRGAIVGLCMLCALVFSAFAAQGAEATLGTTAFTCVSGVGTLRGEHCLTTGTASATFGHVAIAENTTTEVTGTNAKTAAETTTAAPAILKVTIAGTPVELSASSVSATGSMENRKNASGEHFVSGTGTLVFTGVTVTKPSTCSVYTDDTSSGTPVEGAVGTVDTKPLKATTEGQGDFVKVEPASGTTLATFWITCTGEVPAALQGTWTVAGSLKCPATGATIICSHGEVTTQNTLKANGQKAGYTGSLTLSGRVKNSGGSFRPLSPTTIETP